MIESNQYLNPSQGVNKWVFQGTDGCGVIYRYYFCVPQGANVEARQILYADRFNYTCNGVNIKRSGWQYSPFVNGVQRWDERIFDGLVQKVGLCGCSPDSCRVDCATAPDGFCCIDHALTNRLLLTLQN